MEDEKNYSLGSLLNFRGETACALLYAIDVYTGRVKDKSMRGDLRSRISSRIPTLILKLLDITTNGLPEGNVNELSNHYKVLLEFNFEVQSHYF